MLKHVASPAGQGLHHFTEFVTCIHTRMCLLCRPSEPKREKLEEADPAPKLPRTQGREEPGKLLGSFQSRCMRGWMWCFLVKVLFHFPEASPSTTHHCSFMESSVSIGRSADLVTRRFTMNLTSAWTKDQIVHWSKAENYSLFYFPYQKISSNPAHLKFWN